MRNYYSLRLAATVYKVIAWVLLVLGTLVIIISSPVWLSMPYSAFYLIGWILLTGLSFMGFMYIAQSIMLMVNVANDVETMTNNSYVLAEKVEKQRVQYEKQSLENQQKIIALLFSLQQGGNTNIKPHINPDDI